MTGYDIVRGFAPMIREVVRTKRMRAWVFLEDDLAAHLRSLYAPQRQVLQVTLGKEVEPCHFANARQSGGSTSARPTASEYDDLLGLKAGPSRRKEQQYCDVLFLRNSSRGSEVGCWSFDRRN